MRRLGYGTDQGRWLMQQVEATADGAPKRRPKTRPQHAFHDESSLSAVPPAATTAAAPDALSVRQGALSAADGKQLLQQPKVLLAIAAGLSFLMLIFYVSR